MQMTLADYSLSDYTFDNLDASFILLKTKFVHGHREVTRLAGALVGVAVVHRDDVYITEDETVIIILL